MKKLVLGAALAMGITAGNNAAAMGGIQIDPTGMGSIAGSTFLTNLGNSFGNFLADDALIGPGANPAVGGSTIWAQNAVPVLGGELTFIFSIPTTAGLTGPAGAVGTALSLVQAAPGSFLMYFDSSADASQTSGLGYGAGAGATLIASGTITVVPPLSFVNLSGAPTGIMDSVQFAIPSISGNGSATIEVDFSPGFIDTNYIVNDLSALMVDLVADDALRLVYNVAAGNRASQAFADGAVTPMHGADGANDFTCGVFIPCDFQAQMNTTFTFFAPQVPEPGTLALLGAALGLFGGARARRKA